jgi:hypothetical protein
MLNRTAALCGAAALLAVSFSAHAQVASPNQTPGAQGVAVPVNQEPPERTRERAQPTPPAFTTVEPGTDAAETFECRSLTTLLRVSIADWEQAGAWFERPFQNNSPTADQTAARQRCLDVMTTPVVQFQENVPVRRPVDEVPRPGM